MSLKNKLDKFLPGKKKFNRLEVRIDAQSPNKSYRDVIFNGKLQIDKIKEYIKFQKVHIRKYILNLRAFAFPRA